MMSVQSTIGVIALLISGLGLGYVGYVHYGPWSEQPGEAALDRTADQPVQAPSPPDQAATARPAPAAPGSTARRMDDFGAGPAGSVVTAPMRDRYRQAFGSQPGGGQAGGGDASDRGGPATTAPAVGPGAGIAAATGAEPPAPAAPAAGAEAPADDRSLETAAVEPATGGAGDASGADADAARIPAYRVIETPPEPASPPAAEVEVPRFDIVRVDPGGNAVIAGRAAPFAEVEVKAGVQVVDRVTATSTGEWVSIPPEPLASGDQELSLAASEGEAAPVISRQVVVVSIPKTSPETPEVAAAAREPVAVILDKAKGGQGRILQAPDRLQGEGQLALKMVDYDEEGAIKLSGEAPPGVPVRIYVDNEPAALVIGDAKGYWITTLDRGLPGGDYILRLDQLDPRGRTVARLETPLTRVTAPPVEGSARVDYVVVQPGNSLWRIARRLSGDGFNYLYIYEANQGQIRDPDVIYPGQVFEVPAGVGVPG